MAVGISLSPQVVDYFKALADETRLVAVASGGAGLPAAGDKEAGDESWWAKGGYRSCPFSNFYFPVALCLANGLSRHHHFPAVLVLDSHLLLCYAASVVNAPLSLRFLIPHPPLAHPKNPLSLLFPATSKTAQNRAIPRSLTPFFSAPLSHSFYIFSTLEKINPLFSMTSQKHPGVGGPPFQNRHSQRVRALLGARKEIGTPTSPALFRHCLFTSSRHSFLTRALCLCDSVVNPLFLLFLLPSSHRSTLPQNVLQGRN